MFYIKKLILFILLIGFFGCSNELTTNLNTENNSTTKEIAQAFMLSGNVQSTDSSWGNNGEITDMFPIYIKGIEEPSYYECKVKLNGEDAGYILVNTNNTDANVPEYTTRGKTFTEKFIDELNSQDFKVYRYSNFQYTVESNSSRGNGEILLSTGFSNQKDMQDAIDELRSNIYNYGSAIGIDKEIITESNNDESSNSRAHDEWHSKELKNKYVGYDHLPWWTYSSEYYDNLTYTGNHVGQTALAFGKAYAYWAKFKGKDKIFDGYDTSGYRNDFFYSTKIFNDLRKLHNDIDGKSGRALEKRVIKLGNSYGYSFECDVDYGGPWRKGSKAYDRMGKDQPVVIDTPSGHAAVEGVKKKYRVRGRRRKRYYNREMWYKINPTGVNDDGAYWICSYARFSITKDINIDGVFHLWD